MKKTSRFIGESAMFFLGAIGFIGTIVAIYASALILRSFLSPFLEVALQGAR